MRCVLILIRKYLWKNKTRSIFLGLSIMISVALITSLMLTIEDFKNERTINTINRAGGDYDGEVSSTNQSFLKSLDNMDIIEDKSFTIILSDIINIGQKHSIQLVGFDNNSTSIFNFKLKEGRYAKGKKEIALESWVLNDFNPMPKIGDKIKLKYLIREIGKEAKIQVEEEFTLVGLFEHIYQLDQDKNISIGYVTEEYAKDMIISKGVYNNDNIPYTAYLKLKPKTDIDKVEKDFVKAARYINFSNSRQANFRVLEIFDKIGLILYIIISISTVIIIYNMFNASIMARTPEIGMLKAIGMSPSQILCLILGEGVGIGIIFIFIGMLCGSGFYTLSVSLIASGKLSFNIFNISKQIVKTCYTLGLLSIIIGSISSARKMAKLSAVEGINCYNYLDVKNVRFYDSNEIGGTTKKFLWDMSKFNVKRNKLRFIITVSSIIVSILLFELSNYLINCQNPAVQFSKAFNADFIVEGNYLTSSISQEELNEIKAIKGVKSVEPIIRNKRYVNVTKCKDKLTKDGLQSIYDSANRIEFYRLAINKGFFYLNALQYGYDNNKLEKLKSEIKEGTIDIGLMEKEPTCILVQNLEYHNHTEFKVGDKINLTERAYSIPSEGETFTIGAILKTDNYIQSDGKTYNEVILSSEFVRNKLNYKGYSNIKIKIDNEKNYENVKEKIHRITDKNQELVLKDYKEELAKVKKQDFKVLSFLYSFVIITAVTSIANIFGVMVMSIILRKKEFAMLRAVGMSRGEVLRLIFNESFIYLRAGGVIGIGIGVPLTYLFFRLVRQNFTKGMTWSFPVWTTLGIIAVISIICLLVSFVASRKVFEESVVDSIRAVE